MPESSHDNQIRANLRGMRQKEIDCVLGPGPHSCHFDVDIMSCQVFNHVWNQSSNPHMALVAWINCDEKDLISSQKQGHCVAKRARRLATAIPREKDAPADFTNGGLNRDCQDRGTCVHNDIMRERESSHVGRIFSVGLAEYKQIGETGMFG
jgi:hypothetical protein